MQTVTFFLFFHCSWLCCLPHLCFLLFSPCSPFCPRSVCPNSCPAGMRQGAPLQGASCCCGRQEMWIQNQAGAGCKRKASIARTELLPQALLVSVLFSFHQHRLEHWVLSWPQKKDRAESLDRGRYLLWNRSLCLGRTSFSIMPCTATLSPGLAPSCLTPSQGNCWLPEEAPALAPRAC